MHKWIETKLVHTLVYEFMSPTPESENAARWAGEFLSFKTVSE